MTGAQPAPIPSSRWASLDVFRGVTMAAMVVVNTPGSWDHVYPPLKHAPWNGCTPTDLIFPFFLFIVGGAMALSKPRRADAPAWMSMLRRAAALFGLGLALNASSMLLRGQFDPATLRVMGVLQRIALCYALAFSITRVLRPGAQTALALAFLVGHAALLLRAPVPGFAPGTLTPDGNFAGWIDRSLLGRAHLYRAGPFDPEGWLGTLPATVTTLMGFWTIGLMRRKPDQFGKPSDHAMAVVAVLGLIALAIGALWARFGGLPVNKSLWTGSYVLLTGGAAMLALAACVLVIERWRWQRFGRPFEILGRNAILLFVGSGLSSRVLSAIPVAAADGRAQPLSRWLYESVCVPIAGPLNGSLLYALVTLAAWWLVLLAFWRRRWFLKI